MQVPVIYKEIELEIDFICNLCIEKYYVVELKAGS